MNWILKVTLDAATPAIVAIIGTWIAILYQRITHKELEKADRDSINATLTNIAGGIIEAGLTHVTTSTRMVIDGVADAKVRAPDAIQAFPQLQHDDVLAKKIVEKVGVLRSSAPAPKPVVVSYPNPETAPGAGLSRSGGV